MNEPIVSTLKASGIAAIILNRPRVGHALSAALVRTLDQAVKQAEADAAVHTLVLLAQGRHFCTGFDLGDLEQSSDADLLERFVQIELLLQRLWRAPLQTVAIAQGRCWGAGADIFTACDRRYVLPDTTLRFPGTGFGIVLGNRRLAARVGLSQARMLLSQGTTVDPQHALQSGLATDRLETLPADGWLTSAQDSVSWLEEQLAPHPVMDRRTQQLSRHATLRALDTDPEAAGDADLATLVRSAALPGLRDRLIAYRDRVRLQHTQSV